MPAKLSPVSFLKAGEYDLVNISLLGRDPVTGRTFEECNDEWRAWLDELLAYEAETRWWQLRRKLRIRVRCAVLDERMGLNGWGP